MNNSLQFVYDDIGESGIRAFVKAFYAKVRTDDVIGPMYPDDDWEGAEQRLADFLIFRCGGSDKYIQERGHPRMRMRHAPFPINQAARDRWVDLMTDAMAQSGVRGQSAQGLLTFFDQFATFMMNTPG